MGHPTGHFSKSTRTGAPPVISVNVKKINPRYTSPLKWPTRQARYYDFNVWSEPKFVEKLRYIHRNPVTRGLVARPEDWVWSSFRHYANEASPVEIESQWTARRREQASIFPTVRTHPTA